MTNKDARLNLANNDGELWSRKVSNEMAMSVGPRLMDDL